MVDLQVKFTKECQVRQLLELRQGRARSQIFFEFKFIMINEPSRLMMKLLLIVYRRVRVIGEYFSKRVQRDPEDRTEYMVARGDEQLTRLLGPTRIAIHL